MSESDQYWKKCNNCKKPIAWSTVFWVCNVSTCNRKRLNLSFCTVACWDAHLPGMNHREAWAVELRSPSREMWAKIQSGEAPDTTRLQPKKEAAETAEVSVSSAPSRGAPSPVIVRRKPSGV